MAVEKLQTSPEAQESKIDYKSINTMKKLEGWKKQEISSVLKETQENLQQIDPKQQKFIENKFIRLDSVFKNDTNVKSPRQALDGFSLDTKRGNIAFKILKDYGDGKNADILIKDGKDKYEIVLQYPETTLQYEMKVTKNGVPQAQINANKIATKYIGML